MPETLTGSLCGVALAYLISQHVVIRSSRRGSDERKWETLVRGG